MKTYPINSTNFHGLYVNDSLCSQEQKDAIAIIKSKLTDAKIADIKNRGYDIFIERTRRSNDLVSVSAMSNFDFTHECAVNTCRKISVGDYNKSFRINDIYDEIDEFEKGERKTQNFAKVMFGVLLVSFMALMAAVVTKPNKVQRTENVKKVQTELADTLSKIK